MRLINALQIKALLEELRLSGRDEGVEGVRQKDTTDKWYSYVTLWIIIVMMNW